MFQEIGQDYKCQTYHEEKYLAQLRNLKLTKQVNMQWVENAVHLTCEPLKFID